MDSMWSFTPEERLEMEAEDRAWTTGTAMTATRLVRQRVKLGVHGAGTVHEMNESRLGAKVFTILFDNRNEMKRCIMRSLKAVGVSVPEPLRILLDQICLVHKDKVKTPFWTLDLEYVGSTIAERKAAVERETARIAQVEQDKRAEKEKEAKVQQGTVATNKKIIAKLPVGSMDSMSGDKSVLGIMEMWIDEGSNFKLAGDECRTIQPYVQIYLEAYKVRTKEHRKKGPAAWDQEIMFAIPRVQSGWDRMVVEVWNSVPGQQNSLIGRGRVNLLGVYKGGTYDKTISVYDHNIDPKCKNSHGEVHLTLAFEPMEGMQSSLRKKVRHLQSKPKVKTIQPRPPTSQTKPRADLYAPKSQPVSRRGSVVSMNQSRSRGASRSTSRRSSVASTAPRTPASTPKKVPQKRKAQKRNSTASIEELLEAKRVLDTLPQAAFTDDLRELQQQVIEDLEKFEEALCEPEETPVEATVTPGGQEMGQEGSAPMDQLLESKTALQALLADDSDNEELLDLLGEIEVNLLQRQAADALSKILNAGGSPRSEPRYEPFVEEAAQVVSAEAVGTSSRRSSMSVELDTDGKLVSKTPKKNKKKQPRAVYTGTRNLGHKKELTEGEEIWALRDELLAKLKLVHDQVSKNTQAQHMFKKFVGYKKFDLGQLKMALPMTFPGEKNILEYLSKQFDSGGGYMVTREFMRGLFLSNMEGLRRRFKAVAMKRNETWANAFERYSVVAGLEVFLGDFKKIVRRAGLTAHAISDRELSEVFQFIDTSGDGKIDAGELEMFLDTKLFVETATERRAARRGLAVSKETYHDRSSKAVIDMHFDFGTSSSTPKRQSTPTGSGQAAATRHGAPDAIGAWDTMRSTSREEDVMMMSPRERRQVAELGRKKEDEAAREKQRREKAEANTRLLEQRRSAKEEAAAAAAATAASEAAVQRAGASATRPELQHLRQGREDDEDSDSGDSFDDDSYDDSEDSEDSEGDEEEYDDEEEDGDDDGDSDSDDYEEEDAAAPAPAAVPAAAAAAPPLEEEGEEEEEDDDEDSSSDGGGDEEEEEEEEEDSGDSDRFDDSEDSEDSDYSEDERDDEGVAFASPALSSEPGNSLPGDELMQLGDYQCVARAAVTPSLEVNLQNPGVLRITTIGDILPIISVRRNKAGGLRLQIGDGSWVSYVSAQGVTLFEFVA